MKKETMDLKALSYFVETAETLSFTRTAENMGVPKSVISKSIAKLEQQLGLKILERTSRVVRLTEAGRILYTRSASLLEEARFLFSDVQSIQKSVNGHLRLAAPPALGRYLSTYLIPDFLKAWPDVKVSLKLSYHYEDLFKEGLDLAFRMGVNHDDGLIQKNLGFANRVIVSTQSYIDQHAEISKPEDLQDHRALQVFEREENKWTLVSGEKMTQVTVKSLFQCSDMEALKSVLLEDVGLAKMPWQVVREDIEQGKLIHILKGWHSKGLPISAVYREGVNKPPKLSVFLEHLNSNLSLLDLAYKP